MNLTYYGHSCFGVEFGGVRLLFDPFISPNELAKSIDPDSVPADYILISHGHFDHLADAVSIARRTGAVVVSNFEIIQWLGGQGVSNAHPMNHGGSHAFAFGSVKYVAAIHSSVLPDGTYGGNPGGFVVSGAPGTFYYSGDTALTFDMKLIGEDFDVDFGVLPIGDNFTMGAPDAAKAATFVGTSKVVGVHYDTFPPIVIEKAAAHAAFDKQGVALHLPKIGETISI